MTLDRTRDGGGQPPNAEDSAAQAKGELTEQRANEICAHLAATHSDRRTHQWMARRTERGWQVAKIGLPPPQDNLKAETRADERPDAPDDPRSSMNRNIGGPYG